MALTSVRVPECVNRNATSEGAQSARPQPFASASSMAAVAMPLLAPDGGTSREPSPKRTGTRPGSTIHASSEPAANLQPTSANDDADAPLTPKRASTPPPPRVHLESCPSFQEQQGVNTKPIFFDRHATFKKIRDDSLAKLAEARLKGEAAVEAHAADAGQASGANAASTMITTQHDATQPHPTTVCPASSTDRSPYLPSWDVAHSGVWRLVEASLINAIMAGAGAEAGALASEITQPSHAAATAATTTVAIAGTPALTEAAGGSANRSSTTTRPHATPFASHRIRDSMAPAHHSPREPQHHHNQNHNQDHQIQIQQQPLLPPPPQQQESVAGFGSLSGWLSRVHSLRQMGSHSPGAADVPASLVPLGLGAALTPCSSFRTSRSLRVIRCHPTEGGGGGESPRPQQPHSNVPSSSSQHGVDVATSAATFVATSAATSVATSAATTAATFASPAKTGTAGSETPRRSGHQHHVAFAAGLAAATSTAAAVSSAGGSAVTGIASAAAAATAAALSTSGALQLGGHAVVAGGQLLLNRVQGAAVKKAAATVAEAVLGPAASVGLRDRLRQRLRVTVAGASVMWFVMNHMALSDTLGHLDFEHDFVASAKLMLDLATSGPSLMENCRELMQIGAAVSLGIAQRVGASGAGVGGGAGQVPGGGGVAEGGMPEGVAVARGSSFGRA